MDILLEIKNLSIEYKSIKEGNKNTLRAVDDVSFKIHSGEIYALAGESGCGKSTIAKAITKLVTPKSGEILFEGKNINKQTSIEKKSLPQKCSNGISKSIFKLESKNENWRCFKRTFRY